MNAEEARKKSNENINYNDELTKIFKLINNEAMKGRFSLNYETTYVEKNIYEVLEKLGYKIEDNVQYYGVLLIEWDE